MSTLSKFQNIQSFNLTTKDFRWLHFEFWEPTEINFFYNKYQKSIISQIIKIPSYEKANKQSKKTCNYTQQDSYYQNIGRWTLNLQSDTLKPLAFCESQIYKTNFSKILVFVSSLQQGLSWNEPIFNNALSLMLSALFIIYECDTLKLIPIDLYAQQDILKLTWNTKIQTMYTWIKDSEFIIKKDISHQMQTIKILNLEKYFWWELPNAKNDLVILNYLIKRVEQHKKFHSLNKPKKTGILGFLFKKR